MRNTAFVVLLAAVPAAFWAGRVTATPRPAPVGIEAPAPLHPGPPAGEAEPRRLAEAEPARAPAAAALTGVGQAGPPPVASPGELRGSVAPLVDQVRGAVVTIQSLKKVRRAQFDDPWALFGGARMREQTVQSLGSGFIVGKDGRVFTNNHVVAGADELVIQLSDGRKFNGSVVGTDPATDVAVVKMAKPPADLPIATLGDSERLRVGDYVLAIGNPLGLGQTVTMGIVSAKNRTLQGNPEGGQYDRKYMDFIQTDAAINQGNSGGPLFNFAGEVVGINSVIINPGVAMNVGFAIPINLARSVGDQLARSGRVARGYLGVGGQDFTTALADKMHVAFAPGALINFVAPKSPADLAGLRPNDVVVAIGERAVTAMEQLPQIIGTHAPGDKVRIGYLRGGKRIDAEVELAAQAPAAETLFGMQLRPVAAGEAAQLGLPAGVGIVVVSVDPRAGVSGTIEEADLILDIDRKPATIEALKALASRFARGGRALMHVYRPGLGRDFSFWLEQ